MAKNNEDRSEDAGKQILLRTPEDKQFMTGVNVQSTPADIRKLAEANYSRAIRASTQVKLSELKPAEEAVSTAQQALNDAVAAWPLPGTFTKDLTDLCDSLKRFQSGVVVPTYKPADDEEENENSPGGITVDSRVAAKELLVRAVISYSGNRNSSSLTVERKYPWSKEILRTHETFQAALKVVSDLKEELDKLRVSLARIEEVGKEAEAIVIEHNLRNSGGLGMDLSESLNTYFRERAQADGLPVLPEPANKAANRELPAANSRTKRA